MNKKLKTVIISIISVLVVIGAFIGGFVIYFYYFDEDTVSEQDYSSCNVAEVNIKGDIISYIPEKYIDSDGRKTIDVVSGEEILNSLEKIEQFDNIKYVLLDIDSTGGDGYAAKDVYDYIKKGLSDKKTISFIRSNGCSSAYYMASASDYIFATKMSDVGSIGVTMSFVNNYEQNKKDGLEYIELATGKYKDMGDPDKKFTEEERILVMEDLNVLKDVFIEDIAKGRNLSIEEVNKLADGSSVSGDIALNKKLIDQVGGWYDVKEYLKNELGEEIEMCNF